MDDALARWLALREPIDFASRSTRLTERIVERLAGIDSLHLVDLGTGAGSNIRYLTTRLRAHHQQWLAVDRSAELLALVKQRTGAETRQADLDTVAYELIAGRHLVTASALLDLVSAAWLRRLAELCHEAGNIPVLFALTYNGQSQCTPADPDDDLVLKLFNQHQHRDKGLGGPAAGPDATEAAVRAFEGVGYTVETDRSDWVIGPEQKELQRELIEGWAFAATETDPAAASIIAAWRARRLQHVDADRSHVIVGHYDLAALR